MCKTKCARFRVENYGMENQKARSWPMVGGCLQYATSATLWASAALGRTKCWPRGGHPGVNVVATTLCSWEENGSWVLLVAGTCSGNCCWPRVWHQTMFIYFLCTLHSKSFLCTTICLLFIPLPTCDFRHVGSYFQNNVPFTLGVRVKKTWGQFEHFWVANWPQVTNDC